MVCQRLWLFRSNLVGDTLPTAESIREHVETAEAFLTDMQGLFSPGICQVVYSADSALLSAAGSVQEVIARFQREVYDPLNSARCASTEEGEKLVHAAVSEIEPLMKALEGALDAIERFEGTVHLHKAYHLREGDVIRVSLDRKANVLLLDDEDYEGYRKGLWHRYYGGEARGPAVELPVPRSDHWHVVIDLGGFAGKVQAGVEVVEMANGRQ